MTMRDGLRVLAAAVATGFWLPTANPAVHAGVNGSWDAAADFCATANPCGAWSYGWFATPESAFTLYTQPSNIGVELHRILAAMVVGVARSSERLTVSPENMNMELGRASLEGPFTYANIQSYGR